MKKYLILASLPLLFGCTDYVDKFDNAYEENNVFISLTDGKFKDERDGNTYSPIQDLLREVRIFPSGFSKYCIGMALTTPGIKRNLFNDRIRKIEKITSTCL